MKRQGGAYIRIDSNNYAVEADEIEELLEEGRYSTMVIVTNQEILLYSDDSPTRFSWESIYDHLQAIEKREVYDKDTLLALTRKYDTPLLIAVSLLLSLLLIFSGYIAGCLLSTAPGSLPGRSESHRARKNPPAPCNCCTVRTRS